MIVTTTPTIEGKKIVEYIGIVTGETMYGTDICKDVLGNINEFVGGRARAYEPVLKRAKYEALTEMQDRAAELGADAVVGVDIDCETMGPYDRMLMVMASGTAVKIE